VVGEELVKNIKWIKEGEFTEKKGAKTLKLVGEVQKIDQVEVVKKVKENKLKEYPLSSRQVWMEVKKKRPAIKQNHFYKIVKENKLKTNPEYCDFVFRNMQQQEDYENTGEIPSGIPCIFKKIAVDFIINIYKNEIENEIQ
jgi:hypothetical protein